jgi:ubiquinone/menaquinone biosynthesis C-methylase UbiE
MECQRKVWDSIAKSWNECRTMVSPSVQNFLREQRGRILDLGCGSGRNFIEIDGQKMYGVDFSGEMIRYAEKKVKEKKMKIELSVQEADRLGFEDAFFDCVICCAVLHCIKGKNKRKKVIDEIYRVVRPGGKVFFSVWGKKSPRLKNMKKEDYVSWTKGLDEKVLRYNYTYDSEEFREEIKKAGFKIDKVWEERNINCIAFKSSQL